MTELLITTRAQVLADLTSRGLADAASVSLLEEALGQRTWWVRQWAEGEPYVPGLVATDLQDALFDRGTRWPLCLTCAAPEEHSLRIEPELGGPDPVWVCEVSAEEIAPLGRLGGADVPG